MARTKKRAAGTKKTKKVAAPKGRASFETFWSKAGKRLVADLKKERGWNQKTLVGQIQADKELDRKVVESVKRLFPAVSAVLGTDEAAASKVPAGAAKWRPEASREPRETVPSFNPDSSGIWSPSDQGVPAQNPGTEF